MKTKLYSMWLKYVRTSGAFAASNDDGWIWNALTAALHYPAMIVDFIVKNFAEFKEHLPAASIVLDMHCKDFKDLNAYLKDIMKPENFSLLKEFANAVVLDVKSRDTHKSSEILNKIML